MKCPVQQAFPTGLECLQQQRTRSQVHPLLALAQLSPLELRLSQLNGNMQADMIGAGKMVRGNTPNQALKSARLRQRHHGEK